MRINGNAVRPGNVIEMDGKLWVAVKTQHVQPGKGGAFLQVELKGLTEKTKQNVRFRSDESVERVHLDEQVYQYLYQDSQGLHCMDNETYEQLTLDPDLLDDRVKFLQDNMPITVLRHDGRVAVVNLPDTVVMEVVEADPAIKGQTASSSFKPALLENGVRIMVPPHIESGTKVVVNIAEGTYLERAAKGNRG